MRDEVSGQVRLPEMHSVSLRVGFLKRQRNGSVQALKKELIVAYGSLEMIKYHRVFGYIARQLVRE